MSRKYLRKKSYLRNCKKCNKLFNANSKYGWVCEGCKEKSKKIWEDKIYEKIAKKKKMERGIK